MKQIYTPYWEWECFQNGMWKGLTSDLMLKTAIEFTSDHKKYGLVMMEVVDKWPNTMLNHLTNNSINKKAFIGHCACSYKLKIPENIVRMAWKYLSEDQKRLANIEAQKAYKKWLQKQNKKLGNMSLFG
jgi:hypothetical protein